MKYNRVQDLQSQMGEAPWITASYTRSLKENAVDTLQAKNKSGD